MGKRHAIVAALGVAGLATVLGPAAGAEMLFDKSKRGGIIQAPTGDPQMLAAFDRAQQTLGDFIEALDGQVAGATGFVVKIPVTDHGKTEYFWINGLSHIGARFSGRIDNRPEKVANVTFGQTIAFSKGQIHDWSYVVDGKTQGSFTTCVLLSREDPAEAQELKTQIGLTCE